jgi:cephalosporin-C deacetylase-like acetyl esterase
MNRLFPLVAAFLCAPLFAQAPSQVAPSAALKVVARAERANATYQVGEKIMFAVSVEEKGKPANGSLIDWVIVKDGLATEQKGFSSVVDGKATVVGSLNEPGFLQLKVTAHRLDARSKPLAVSAMAGAAVEPTKIPLSLPVPDDFDAFWDGMRKKLAAVPVAPAVRPVKSPLPEVESFDVTAPALGQPISAYMAKPAGAKPRSLPIILTVHGAGVNDSSLGGSASWAAKGFLAMDMNAHGLPNGKPRQYYADLYAGPMKGYRYENRDDREKSYFTGMMLRLVRAIDVLTAQPEWDGKHVVVSGASQGGYQAIAAAGIDGRVTFFAAGVPAGCDHSGMLVNRIAGWPKIVPVEDGKPDLKVVEAARYIDCVNFAARTKAKGAYFTVGFIDTTCPPTSIYAAYNQLNIPKQIYDDIPSGHSHSQAARDGMTKAVLKHVGK